jgi:CheY-like chemotaxis protein
LILFIDDEERYVRSYIDELALAGFKVHFCSKVESALHFLDSSKDQVDLCIVDIMMPPGKTFATADSQGGVRTGLLFYDYIRQQALHLPIIVLTNRTSDEVERKVATDDFGWLFRKDQCFPFELANHIKDIFAFSAGKG